MTILQEIMAGNGTMLFIDSGNAQTNQNFRFLVVNQPCTLSVLTSAGGQNLITAYNLSGKVLAGGVVIKGAKGENITAVTVTAGSVLAYTSL